LLGCKHGKGCHDNQTIHMQKLRTASGFFPMDLLGWGRQRVSNYLAARGTERALFPTSV